jgi:CheY-like chemotaxis protein
MQGKYYVLIVEDEPDIVKLTKQTLEIGGFFVDIANSGQECLEKINQKKPHIILLDILLNDINGIEILNKMKNDINCRDIKVVVFTAIAEKEKIKEFARAGADAYISKPFDPYELIDKIKEIVRAQ